MHTETQEFWCRGYYVDTVIKNTKAITQYIKNQLENDRMTDQLALFDPKDPFSKGQLVTDATLAGTHMHIYVQLIVLGPCPKMKQGLLQNSYISQLGCNAFFLCFFDRK